MLNFTKTRSPFRFLILLPYLTVAFGLAGVSANHCREFVKHQVGPLYILEWLLIIAGVFLILLRPRLDYRALLRGIAPVLPFFLWGCVLLGLDFRQEMDHRHLLRMLQHAILFVYPFIWVALAQVLYQTEQRYTLGLVYLIFLINVLPNLWGEIPWNIALGPLMAVLFPYLLALWCDDEDAFLPKPWILVGVVISGLLLYGPFLKMWLYGLQRTTVVIFIGMIPTVPLLVFRRPRGTGKAYTLYGISLTLFALCLTLSTHRELLERRESVGPTPPATVVAQTPSATSPALVAPTTPAPRPTAPPAVIAPAKPVAPAPIPPPEPRSARQANHLKHLVLAKIEHGEDKPIEGDDSPLQMRTRRYMWKIALSDWRSRPVTGIGFIPEVPSSVGPGLPNNGNYEKTGYPPVSGPHNSYLSVLARTGIVGFLLFAAAALYCLYAFVRYLIRSGPLFVDLVLFFILFSGSIYALFNVGFESPHRTLVFWFAFGVLWTRSSSQLLSNQKAMYYNQPPSR